MKRIILKENSLHKLLGNFLLEREMKNSTDASILVSIAKKYNFFPVYNLENLTNQDFFTLYYDNKKNNPIDSINKYGYDITLSNDFDKLVSLVKRCGWVINQAGNHFDGLRNFYTHFEEEHPEFGVGTFFVNIEKEYGSTMDDYFGTDENELKNNDEYQDKESIKKYGDDTHYGVKYQRGIFYHITPIKNLKSIMAHGLRPKNGGGIAQWRNSSERLYLSLLPNFRDVEMDYFEDENAYVLLKIDLRGVMKNFDFYVDNKYENAVFTYSTIPPQFIERVNAKEIYDSYWYNFNLNKSLEDVVEYNFGNYSDRDKKSQVEYYYEKVFEIIRKRMITRIQQYNIDDTYKNNLNNDITNIMDNYIDS